MSTEDIPATEGTQKLSMSRMRGNEGLRPCQPQCYTYAGIDTYEIS